MRPSRVSLRGLAAAVALAAMLAAMDAAWGQAATGPNYSSHAASFFEELLAGRVWVLERPNSARADDRGTAWAHYHAPDGRLLACAHLGGEYAGAEARWRVVPSRAFRALYTYYWSRAPSPIPAGAGGTRPSSTTRRPARCTTRRRGLTAAGRSPRAAGCRRAGRGR